jgi:beta-1,4-mannosyl-glycoprotein beta-1,4-N-acetylglucosaminyltransferase
MAVIDAFTYFNEADILEIRLRELSDVVDRFVLVEATRTHKGDPKPLYYAENRHRFGRWNSKIINIVIGDLPDGNSPAAIWRREIMQRQGIMRGLMDAADDDIVLISDVDEIPRRQCVPRSLPDDLVAVYQQRLYYYNVNTHCTNIKWQGTRATTAGNVRALTPDGIRWSGQHSHDYPRLAAIENAGWHLSYFGDVAHIQQKMHSFLHQELVNADTTDPDAIARRMAEGVDIWGRKDQQRFDIGPASDLPAAIRCNPQAWARYFHPDWRPQFVENWYDEGQLDYVSHLATLAPQEGAMVEIGCWEGRSTAAIAQTIAPRLLHCVDHWQGNGDEDAHHPAAVAASERDVFATFVQNMERLTSGNWCDNVADWRDWLTDWERPIAFLHLDAAHDYQSVYDCLQAVKPFLVPGAVLCGDDAYADGVWTAVRDALGNDAQIIGGRLWVWQQGAAI